MSEEEYFTKQILTYMGNKRTFLNKIDDVITIVKKELNQENINIGDGFSGSGIVSRLFKNRVMGNKESSNYKNLYVNDMSGYSKTLNKCYLTSTKDLSEKDIENLIVHMKRLRSFLSSENNNYIPFISKYWSPQNDKDIKEGERAYFTNRNACNIDKIMYYIKNNIDERYQAFFVAPLIVQCSIHNNTNGQFSAYYKNEEKTKGMYGGKKSVDLKRILGEILPQMPILTEDKANVHISQMNTNKWIKEIPEVDLMYYDPPYNKHPYNIYYFLLDIINTWDTNMEVPDTYRGQPKDWVKTPYCSLVKARDAFDDLIKNTKAKYILVSYNSKGIIPLNELDSILEKYGELRKIPVNPSVYNKLIGIASKKRQKENKKIYEFLWLLKKSN
jgi:adenine-specific DNA-methyltransferase